MQRQEGSKRAVKPSLLSPVKNSRGSLSYIYILFILGLTLCSASKPRSYILQFRKAKTSIRHHVHRPSRPSITSIRLYWPSQSVHTSIMSLRPRSSSVLYIIYSFLSCTIFVVVTLECTRTHIVMFVLSHFIFSSRYHSSTHCFC